MCIVTIALDTVVGFVTKHSQKVNRIESVFSCNQFFQKGGSFKLYIIISVTYVDTSSITIVACDINIYETIRQHNTTAAPPSEGAFFLWGGGGEDNKNVDCCWILFQLASKIH